SARGSPDRSGCAVRASFALDSGGGSRARRGVRSRRAHRLASKGADSLQLFRLRRDRRGSGADATPRLPRLDRRRLGSVFGDSSPFAARDRSFPCCCCRACDSHVEGGDVVASGSRGSRRPPLGGGDVLMAAAALIAVGILSLLVFVLFG